MKQAAPLLAALAMTTLAACAPHVPAPYKADTGTATLPAPRTCGAGNPLCAPGGRPNLIALPDGTVALARPGWAPTKGKF